jgi:hypothetical protein
MTLIVLLQAVDAQESLAEVQLSGVLAVGSPLHAGLFGYPAFVADVSVAAAGIHRR